MKLEYLHNVNEGGRKTQMVSEKLVRLYDFGIRETRQLVEMIRNMIKKGKTPLAVHEIEFVEAVNCKLTLQVANRDFGMMRTANEKEFECLLTAASFESLAALMSSTEKGHNWLCDTSDDNIDFLYSTKGPW